MTAIERQALRDRAAITREKSVALTAQSLLLRRRLPAKVYAQDEVLDVIKRKLIPRP